MAKNDVILLDGIITQRLSEHVPSDRRDEVFEFFVLEQALKDFDLDSSEIEAGWVDGGGDGGIDGFFIFVNGHILEDPDNFPWPRSNASLEVWLFTCKHHPTFLQATIDAFIATLQEFFDLGVPEDSLCGMYSEELRALRTLFCDAYRRLSIGRPQVRFKIIYGSRGDTSSVGESVRARARQVEQTIATLFSSASAEFSFVGATELVDMHRRTQTFCLDLPFIEHLATERNSYVLRIRSTNPWGRQDRRVVDLFGDGECVTDRSCGRDCQRGAGQSRAVELFVSSIWARGR